MENAGLRFRVVRAEIFYDEDVHQMPPLPNVFQTAQKNRARLRRIVRARRKFPERRSPQD
jgi:hypothetical protein